ncbi:hypothetical protein [Fusobacterium hominis]|uniref:Uncharacterized protein n=1 Tax=Fusobacterium hominis TaxID=2764326 RepID=A0A7G9GXE9_9FUSO|nr:hypothetical protein [Fusobacterium hominis]QNM15481.1 hypothetical protein H9Q81_01180 [Fusobacterium hominis]
MIIKDKILSKYTSEEIEKRLGIKKYNFYKNSFRGTLNYLAELFDIDYLDYTFNDFLIDYPRYQAYKEADTIFNLLKKGYTYRSFALKYNVVAMSHVQKQLKTGFIYNTSSIPWELFEFINLKYDFNKFRRIEYYKNHIEIYDDKEVLEEFREHFNLREKVYFEKYKNSWHLATKGFLADYIKYINKKLQ